MNLNLLLLYYCVIFSVRTNIALIKKIRNIRVKIYETRNRHVYTDHDIN